jgi:plastocyanin
VLGAVRGARVLGAVVAASLGPLMFACGGSSDSTTPTSPTGACTTGPNTTTIVITSAGAVCPANITVARGAQVTFTNNDKIGHDMFSDPHPDHNDCPEINQVGHLEPGQSRQTGNLVIARVCGYHDHVLFTNTALQGKITIQ